MKPKLKMAGLYGFWIAIAMLTIVLLVTLAHYLVDVSTGPA